MNTNIALLTAWHWKVRKLSKLIYLGIKKDLSFFLFFVSLIFSHRWNIKKGIVFWNMKWIFLLESVYHVLFFHANIHQINFIFQKIFFRCQKYFQQLVSLEVMSFVGYFEIFFVCCSGILPLQIIYVFDNTEKILLIVIVDNNNKL